MKTQLVLLQPCSGSHFSLRNSTHTALGAPKKGPTGPEAKGQFTIHKLGQRQAAQRRK